MRRRPGPGIKRRPEANDRLDDQHPEDDDDHRIGACQRFHHHDRAAEADRGHQHDQLTDVAFADPGPDDDGNADYAERDGHAFAKGDPLAEEQRGKNRRPNRHGEFDRHHLRHRNQCQRQEPEILRDIMHRIAADMLQRPRRGHSAKAAIHAHQGIEQADPDQRAHLGHLEYAEFTGALAAGHQQEQHQCKPTGHPQGGLEVGLLNVKR